MVLLRPYEPDIPYFVWGHEVRMLQTLLKALATLPETGKAREITLAPGDGRTNCSLSRQSQHTQEG